MILDLLAEFFVDMALLWDKLFPILLYPQIHLKPKTLTMPSLSLTTIIRGGGVCNSLLFIHHINSVLIFSYNFQATYQQISFFYMNSILLRRFHKWGGVCGSDEVGEVRVMGWRVI